MLNEKTIHEQVQVEGLEYLETAYAEGKGVIMATGHYGNWELLGATVALHGYPMLSITRKQNNSHMDKAINEFREMVGQQVTYNRGKHGLLAISRMLKEKNLLGVLLTRILMMTALSWIYSVNVLLSPWVRTLSRIYGSPILPIFMHNNDDGTCCAKIYPPLYTQKTGDKQRDFYQVTRKLVDILEMEIINHPEMWFWVHDRWKDGRQRFGKKK